MKYICPECDKTIFNRRLSHCEFCNVELPEELLYSTVDLERIDKEYLVSAEKRRMSRASKEHENMLKRSHDIGSITGFD